MAWLDSFALRFFGRTVTEGASRHQKVIDQIGVRNDIALPAPNGEPFDHAEPPAQPQVSALNVEPTRVSRPQLAVQQTLPPNESRSAALELERSRDEAPRKKLVSGVVFK